MPGNTHLAQPRAAAELCLGRCHRRPAVLGNPAARQDMVRLCQPRE
eukprot:COSAG01_NODE_2898_length_6893_cov_45.927878_3_plen_46_part_00